MATFSTIIYPYVFKNIMVEFKIEVVHDSLGVIYTIQGRQTQVTIWTLKFSLIAGLRKLNHMNHPIKGYGQYLCTNAKQGLISNIYFSMQKQMGEYFVIPDSAFTNMRQTISESQWEAEMHYARWWSSVSVSCCSWLVLMSTCSEYYD